jgi:hypothetical protein
MASQTVSPYDFSVLQTNDLTVSGVYTNSLITLKWVDNNQSNTAFYEIGKYDGNTDFTKIGTVFNMYGSDYSTLTSFSFTDYHPLAGNNTYRIKAILQNGQAHYSGILTVNADPARAQSFYVAGNYSGAGVSLIATLDNSCKGTIAIYNILGQLLQKTDIQLSKGSNTIELPVSHQKSIQVVSLFINGRIAFSQKILY